MAKKPFTIEFYRFPEQTPKHGATILVMSSDSGTGLERLDVKFAKVEWSWDSPDDSDDTVCHSSRTKEDKMLEQGFIKVVGLDFDSAGLEIRDADTPYLWNYVREINKVFNRAKI